MSFIILRTFSKDVYIRWKQGKNETEMLILACGLCRMIRSYYLSYPAVFITDNGGSLYITCSDVVICDSWLTATWTVHTIRQSIMLATPAPEATAQKCYICLCSDWHCLSTEEYTPSLITHSSISLSACVFGGR